MRENVKAKTYLPRACNAVLINMSKETPREIAHRHASQREIISTVENNAPGKADNETPPHRLGASNDDA